jgi:outer membrane protein assembly factor BamA
VTQLRTRWQRAIGGVFALMGAVIPASRAAAEPAEKPHTELGGFPLVGYDSDLGFGGGGFASFARFEPGFAPYRYRLEAAGAITFKPSDGGLQLPYQDIYLQLIVPQLASRRMRLEARVSYTRETTLAYYGIGNAAPAPEEGPQGQPARDYFHYGLTHPSTLLRVRLKLSQAWSIQFGHILTYERPDVRVDSLVAHDARDPALDRFFGPLTPHWVQLLETTLIFDTRDEETSTSRGMFHHLRLRLSPGGVEPFPYRYGQLDLTLRFFETFGRLIVAARLVGDMQFGDVPFYELPRYEDTFALGGANGVRGVPAQRYSGKLKVLGNLELRYAIAKFRLIGLPCLLSAVSFFDGGRLWSALPADPALDGRGLGLKFGIGAGVRLQQGQAFVVRADVAWSPDARPLGAYVIAGQMF